MQTCPACTTPPQPMPCKPDSYNAVLRRNPNFRACATSRPPSLTKKLGNSTEEMLMVYLQIPFIHRVDQHLNGHHGAHG